MIWATKMGSKPASLEAMNKEETEWFEL